MGFFEAFTNLDQLSPEKIAAGLKHTPSFTQIENYLANRILYPQAIPQTVSDMQMDLAILREAGKMEKSKVNSNPKPAKFSVSIRVRVERSVVTRVVRTLKGKGLLNVSVGQQVEPSEILGSAILSAGFRIVNLSQELQVIPKDAGKYLTRSLGQRIYKGELLALKKEGLFGGKKVVTAPTDGVVDFLDNKTGEVRISLMPKKIDLPAGVYGIVEDVDKERGQVIIRTEVTRVHGVLGSGRLRDGILHILGKKEDLIGKEAISAKLEGKILVGGSLFFKDTISAAIKAGIAGIITGGINAGDYRGMASGRLVFPGYSESDIGIGVVVCEGFGVVPIAGDIFETLSQYEGKFVFIDGNQSQILLPSSASSSLNKVKTTQLPQIIKNSLSTSLPYTSREAELKAGLKVRVAGNAYLGEQGRILAVDGSLTLLPSGIKSYLATLETDRRKIQVPVANLEIIV